MDQHVSNQENNGLLDPTGWDNPFTMGFGLFGFISRNEKWMMLDDNWMLFSEFNEKKGIRYARETAITFQQLRVKRLCKSFVAWQTESSSNSCVAG